MMTKQPPVRILCPSCGATVLQITLNDYGIPETRPDIVAIQCKNMATGDLNKCRFPPGSPEFDIVAKMYWDAYEALSESAELEEIQNEATAELMRVQTESIAELMRVQAKATAILLRRQLEAIGELRRRQEERHQRLFFGVYRIIADKETIRVARVQNAKDQAAKVEPGLLERYVPAPIEEQSATITSESGNQ